MEPVEINAGEFYLRKLRYDERIDDGPAIAEAFADQETSRWLPRIKINGAPAARLYIKYRSWQWENDQQFSWGICESVTGELVGEVGLRSVDLEFGCAEAMCWTHPAHRGKGIAVQAVTAVLNYGFHGIGLHRIGYRHGVHNKASQRVAEKCGFTLEGRLREEEIIGDQREDMLLWARLATDPAPDSLP